MKVACIGDSLTECRVLPEEIRWATLLGRRLNVEVNNFGIAGDTTGGMLSRFQRVLMEDKFTHCYLMGGTNDIWYGATWRQILPNIFAMVRHAQFLKVTPVIGIPPLFVIPEPENDPYALFPPVDGYESFIHKMEEYREILIKFCVSENLSYGDVLRYMCSEKGGNTVDETMFLDDGLHFNEQGCCRVADCVEEAIKKA